MDLCGNAMFVIDCGEGLVELAAERIGHHGGITHGHFEALVAEHPADRFNLHPVLPPLNGQRVSKLMAGGSWYTSDAADPSDQVIQRIDPWAATSPCEEEVPHLFRAFIMQQRLWPAAKHPGVKRFDQSGTHGDHAIVVQLAYRYTEPVCGSPGCGVLCGDDATRVESAQFTSSQATLQQYGENRS
jgi:hypothetical protein